MYLMLSVINFTYVLQRFDYYYRHCSCPVCVCMCVSVGSFLPPRASKPRKISTYVFTVTRKNLDIYNRDFRLKCFIKKLQCHLLASNVTTDAYNLIFAPYYAPWPWPCTVYDS